MSFEVISPETKDELLETINSYKNKKIRFGAGYTDLLLELKRQPQEGLTVINLARVKDGDLTSIVKNKNGMYLGSMVTARNIVLSSDIRKTYPVLHEAAYNLASTQIRQVATIGGNLCTASPSGDMTCALTALKATCEILASDDTDRSVPITSFITGIRKTSLNKNELLYKISLPFADTNMAKTYSHFIKIGTRLSMECSVVSLAYHIQVDKNDRIISAGVAIGASAPTIRFAEKACDYLIGKKMNDLSEKERGKFAEKVLKYASPISDIRATAWYRKEVLFNISKSIFEINR